MMSRMTMSWNKNGCQLLCYWSRLEGKKSVLVVPTNEPLLQQFEDWNSDVVFELGDGPDVRLWMQIVSGGNV